MRRVRRFHRVTVGVGAVAALGSMAASVTGSGRHLGAQAAALRSPIGLANAATAGVGALIGAWPAAMIAGAAASLGLVGSVPVGRHRHGGAATGDVTLITANVLLDNGRFDELLDGLLTRTPDVLLLQEVTPEHGAIIEQRLRAHPEFEALIDPRAGYSGWTTLTRFPVVSDGVIDIDDWTASWVVIDHPDTPLRVVNVHAPAPQTRADHTRWQRYLDALHEFADGSIPTVLAGDFNATFDHRPLRRLRSAGVADGFDRAGSGWGATWPAGRFAIPLLRLDHVMVDEGLMVEHIESVALVGSDHHGLSAVLRPTSVRHTS